MEIYCAKRPLEKIARRSQAVLVWTALGSFSAAAFFGQGLHLLEEADSHLAAHGYGSRAAGEHGASVAARAATEQHDCNTCPICIFLGTSKALAAAAPLAVQTAWTSQPPLPPLPCRPALRFRPLGARGPPAI